MSERNAAAGYMAIGKQTAPTTPVVPSLLTPYYKQSLETSMNLIQDKPVYGSKFEIFQNLEGVRSHKGALTVMAEPSTAGQWLDMLLTKLSTTGTNPYTHTFGLSTTQDPNFYTIDISMVSQVVRFFGVAASKMALTWQNEELMFDMTVSALGSYYGREVASISGQIITLTTTYDPAPTTGLVVGDLMSGKSTDGTRNLPLVVSSLTPTTVTVTGTITTLAAGDMLVLRPNTALVPTPETPFIWPLANYKFGATAAAALSGTQTRIEPGTTFDITHSFENDGGEPRSGGFDPASLIRTTGIYSYKIKQYFDNPDVYKEFMSTSKEAATQQFFSGSATHELRIIQNHMAVSGLSQPTQFGSTIYQEITFDPAYDTTDGQGLSVVLINGVPTI